MEAQSLRDASQAAMAGPGLRRSARDARYDTVEAVQCVSLRLASRVRYSLRVGDDPTAFYQTDPRIRDGRRGRLTWHLRARLRLSRLTFTLHLPQLALLSFDGRFQLLHF